MRAHSCTSWSTISFRCQRKRGSRVIGTCWGKTQHPFERAVPKLDALKEQVAYRKLLQGIAVVTFISLVGWLISASTGAPLITIVLAIVGVVLLGMVIIALHRDIEQRIDEIRKL